MINKNIILALLVLILSLASISSVSAAVITDVWWKETGTSLITIEEGDSTDLFIWISTTKNKINYEVKLLDSNYEEIETIVSAELNGQEYSSYITITKDHYQKEGDYIIRVIGRDSQFSNYKDLILTVNEKPSQNQPPTLNPIGNKNIVEGQHLNFEITASDPNGDDLTFEIQNKPTGAVFTDNKDNTATFDWTPDYTQAGIYTINFIVKDNKGEQDLETIKISVKNTEGPLSPTQNEKPTAIISKVVPETSITYPSKGNEIIIDKNVYVNFEGYGTGYEIIAYEWKINGQIYSNSKSFRTQFTIQGNHLVEFRVRNEFGTWSDPDTQLIIVKDTVSGNHNPVIGEIGTLYAREDSRFYYKVKAYDQDGDKLTFSDNTKLFNIDSETGEIRFTPDRHDIGTYSITITVTDGKGGIDTEEFTLKVRADNHYVWDDEDDEEEEEEEKEEKKKGTQFKSYTGGASGCINCLEETEYNWCWIILIALILIALGSYLINRIYKNYQTPKGKNLPKSYY